ncbi:hypothetical protein BDP27DRAFT_1403787 [Rhodocollybia butyracea]|uniref:Uncharacterized protein n=1 Tax=Rhodocollybia butyracea TaxID=206335 RepID=A0A9P5PQ97_9AGAR|nr:hypothetical protein BDP27DRAFT_1403787 [Rhodocollybia butyracea]
MMLPEEILYVVVSYLVSNPRFIERKSLDPHWRYDRSRSKLVSLSLANSQLRRICMPILFAYIEVRGLYGDLEKLTSHCVANQAFASCIKTIDYYCYNPDKIDTLRHLFARLNNLSHFILNQVVLDKSLLDTVRRHSAPTVILASHSLTSKALSVVNTESLPDAILDYARIYDEEGEALLVKHLEFGIKVKCLTILPKLLYKSFGLCQFRGLCELELWLASSPVDISWLPEFIDGHPLLHKIRFSNSHVWNMNKTIPFILPFIEAIETEGIVNTLELKAFSVTRNKQTAPSMTDLSGWHVTGLWLCITEWSSGRILQLANSVFPHISTLTIGNPLPAISSSRINTEELATLLRLFSSLQYVNFQYLFTPSSPVHAYGPAPKHDALIEYTSSIVQHIPTIETFLMQEIRLQAWIDVEDDGKVGRLCSLGESEKNHLFSLYV